MCIRQILKTKFRALFGPRIVVGREIVQRVLQQKSGLGKGS